MKSLVIFIIFLAGFNFANAQNKAKDNNPKSIKTSFQVRGVCDRCKERIETAAIYTKGVKFASWDKEHQMISVVYNPKKTTEEKIHQSIAGAGHDTSKASADAKAYQELPDHCRYRDGLKIH